ncbi:MAG: ABC transporter permease subunit [Actinomycetota bacterium]|nr:ABC transporter permease subunit [Actinomycetota bacterium]
MSTWRARLGRLFPTLVLIASALFFLLPVLSSARFALQKVPMVLLNWSNVFDGWSLRTLSQPFKEDNFWPTLSLSLKLAGGTVALTLGLLVPTALFVHLRLPKARAFVEFLTVLPYVVPPIALVAGVAAFFRPNARWYLNSEYALVPLYVVMALPFTYRSIDAGIKAIDVRTLVDASRSLGAGWVTTFRRALFPNLMSSLVSSSFLTATVVLGEFTMANTLAKRTFPTFLYEYYGLKAQSGTALALMTLIGTTALLGIFTLFTRRRGARVPTRF